MPGQSGNPKGRPKAPVDIAALARVHGPKCIEIAVELLASSDERIRLAAVTALLERGYGKPAQPLSSDPDNPLTLRYVIEMPPAIESKEEWRRRYAPPMIETEPVKG
jgi:hypothetical protein